MKRDAKRKSITIDGNLNSENHISLLWSNHLQDYEDEGIFQHDSVPFYTSCATKRFIVDKDVQHLEDRPSQNRYNTLCNEDFRSKFR